MDSHIATNTNPMFHFVVSCLPDRVKKLVLLGSFAGVVKRVVLDGTEKDTVTVLNSILNLASKDNPAAIEAPVYMAKFIWRNLSVVEPEIKALLEHACDTDEEYTQYATRIVDSIPDWFRYDAREDMIEDFVSMFQIEIPAYCAA